MIAAHRSVPRSSEPNPTTPTNAKPTVPATSRSCGPSSYQPTASQTKIRITPMVPRDET